MAPRQWGAPLEGSKTKAQGAALRLKAYQEQQNQQAREDSLDQVDEARDMALLHFARYQQSLRRYQAQRVRRRDLVGAP